MAMNTQVAKGLEGVVVDESAISLVDGERGQLSYRGYDVADLVQYPFAAVALLVLQGELPSDAQMRSFEQELHEVGRLSARELTLLQTLAQAPSHPMQILQGIVPVLDRPRACTAYGEAAQGLVIAAKLPQLIANLIALRTSAPLPQYPARSEDTIERFLKQLPGGSSELRARALRMTQILQVEHSFNASTFCARVVASTLAPVENCISGALGTLHGPLHGGADQAALEMAEEIGDPARAAQFVDECLNTGRKIMGMGHREYKVLDPRARFVKDLAAELATTPELKRLYETLVNVEARFRERMLQKGKSLYANLEFYKGVVYRAIGLPPEFFTPGFAMARVFGYTAHFIESRKDNRLIRPSVKYTGRLPAPATDPLSKAV